MRVRVLLLLCTVICVFTVTVTPYTSVRSAYYIFMHEISLLWIPKQRPFCKLNPKTGSPDYTFLNPGSRDCEFNPRDCNH